MSVTIVLAEGFDGERVELIAAGQTHLTGPARTSLLTGMADEFVVDADDGPVEVRVRLVAAPAWDSYDVPQGAVLVLSHRDDGLYGRVLPGPLGFA